MTPLERKDYITSWPAVDLGKIFHYILEKEAFEADYVGQYKVKKACSYFKSGAAAQILSLVLYVRGKNVILLKSSTLPSQVTGVSTAMVQRNCKMKEVKTDDTQVKKDQ